MFNDAIFRTSAETHLHHIAMQASRREAFQFIFAKGTVAIHHLSQRGLREIAHLIVIKHITVAPVCVPVAFDHGAVATDRFMDAQSCRAMGQVAYGGLEYLDELVPDILLPPAIKYLAEEMTIAFRRDGERSELGDRHRFVGIKPRRELDAIVVIRSLYHREELHKVGDRAEELIDLRSARFIYGVYGRKRIVLDSMLP